MLIGICISTCVILIVVLIIITQKQKSVQHETWENTPTPKFSEESNLISALHRYIFLIRAYNLNYINKSPNLEHIKLSLSENHEHIATYFNNIYQITYSVIYVAIDGLTKSLIRLIENNNNVDTYKHEKISHPLENAQLIAGVLYNANNKYDYNKLKSLLNNIVELIIKDINVVKSNKPDVFEYDNTQKQMLEFMNYIIRYN